jgi:hypothetical protein
VHHFERAHVLNFIPREGTKLSQKFLQFTRNVAQVFPIKIFSRNIDQQVTNAKSPPNRIELSRYSVGDWARTSRALPTSEWTLA